MSRVSTVLLMGVGLVAVVLVALWLGQRRLIYFPSRVVPADVPAGVEQVELATDDGLELAAWFVPAERSTGTGATGTATADEGPATVVVFPGNGGNRAGRVPLARALSQRGHDVLLVDYRGYGGNPGSPTATGLASDARAARAWVDDQHVAAERVVYHGESLGAAVAIELALEQPPAAMVLRSPFTSMAAMVRAHYPLVPPALLRDRWPSLDRIDDLAVPMLFVGGTADRIVPLAQTRALHDAAENPAALLVIEDAGHNDPALLHGTEMIEGIDEFLDAHLAD